MSISSSFQVEQKNNVPPLTICKQAQNVHYAQAVGSLMYAMVCTQTNIAEAVRTTSKFCIGAKESELIAYSYSDLARDIDGRKSTSGNLINHSGEYWHGKVGYKSV
jgi:hypothetical protein